MKRWKIIGSVVLAAAIVGAVFALYPRSSKSVAAIPAGQVVEVKTGTLQLTVNASGAVSLPRQVKLTFGSSGVVAEVKVRTGDRVQKGQVLAKLDTSDLERSLARAEDDLKLARERQRIGYSSADLARAQAAVGTATANLAKAQADLDATTLQRSSAQAAVDTAKANLAKAEADLNASILERSNAQAAVDTARANLAKAEADLNLSSVERDTAQAAVDQARQNLENLQKRAPLDIWDVENTEKKAEETFLATTRLVSLRGTTEAQVQNQVDEAWQAWQRAQVQTVVTKQTIANAMTDAQNALARAQDNLSRLMPGGSTIQQREVAVAAAKAAVVTAEDNLSRLMPGGVTIQQREASVAAAKAALASAQDDLAKLMPGGATIQQAEAAVVVAKASLDKAQEDLTSMKVGASSPYDQLSQQVAITKLESSVADAKDSLAKATIRAPYDGTVNDVNVKEGDTVSGGAVAIVLIDTSVKEVQATVDEVDVAQLRLGQDANVTFDALPDVTAKARVVALAPDAKVQSGVVSYAVTVALLPPDTTAASPQPRAQTQAPRQGGAISRAGGAPPTGGRARAQGATVSYETLKGGMTALAQIVIQRKDDVLLVPNRAIKTSGQNRTVQVVLPTGLTETRKVTTGISDGQNTEIVDGLSQGEKVFIPAATSPAARSGSSQFGQPLPKVPGMPRF